MCTEFGVCGMHDCFSPAGHELFQRKCALSSVCVACMIASVHLNMNWSGHELVWSEGTPVRMSIA